MCSCDQEDAMATRMMTEQQKGQNILSVGKMFKRYY